MTGTARMWAWILQQQKDITVALASTSSYRDRSWERHLKYKNVTAKPAVNDALQLLVWLWAVVGHVTKIWFQTPYPQSCSPAERASKSGSLASYSFRALWLSSSHTGHKIKLLLLRIFKSWLTYRKTISLRPCKLFITHNSPAATNDRNRDHAQATLALIRIPNPK